MDAFILDFSFLSFWVHAVVQLVVGICKMCMVIFSFSLHIIFFAEHALLWMQPTLHFFQNGKKASEVIGADVQRLKDTMEALYKW